MATEREQPKVWRQKSKIDEELDYFTELALHESERWMQAVTRKKFKYPDDPRKSLEDGILMCELLNGLKPGTIRKVNRLPTPLAGMDNVNVFLEACSKTFGLKEAQLFHPCDLEDLSKRAFADSQDQLKYETDRRLRNVVVTVYWLGRTVQTWYKGPHLDCSAFSDLLGYHHPKVRLTNVESSSENILSEELHCRQESCDSLDCSSGYSSYRGDSKTSSSSYSQHHSRQESSDSIDRASVYIRNDNTKSSLSSDVFEDDPVTSQLRDEPYESFMSEDLPLTCRLNTEKRQSDNITPDTGETDNMPIPQEYRRRTSHGNRFAEQRYSATFDSPYTPPPEGATSPNLLSNRWKNDAVYQSTPQLNRAGHDDCNRFRFGGNKLEKQGKASSSSDNIDGVKPGERRNSYLPPVQVRKASTAHVDPLQFVYVGGSQLSQKAKEVIEAMEEQKKVTKALEHEELDWHSNLSSWKSKMRTKNKAAHERTEEIDKTLEDPEPSHRKSKTFGEMMAERERRKSTGRNFYPYTEEDVGALGGVNRLNSAQTTQDSATVTSAYRKSTDSNSQSSDSAHIRRAEAFESEHSVKTNNNQPSSRVTESSTTQSYNRYTVSQNARTRTKSQPDNAGKTTRDRGREMMERRKEESENQEFEEKTIKISQKPNGEKGFGFTIGGGKEHCCPIVIEKVSLGSAADAYGLVEGDEIAAINGVAMDDSYQGSVLYVINQAVRTGLMDLRIRRYPFADSDESEDEREQEQQRQEELEHQRQEEEQQRLKQEQEQEEQRRRELEEQQRQETQREEQLHLEQQREQQRHLKRQQLEKQREELRQQKLQQLEQQRLKQQKQEPLPWRRRQQEQQPQEQQLVEKQQERRRQEEQQQKEQQQRIEQQQEAEHQHMEQQWLEKQQQEQQRQEQQQKEQQWLEQQQQEQQQQLQELEQNRVEQQQQEQQQWEQQQWEQQQQLEGEQQNEQLPGEQLRQEEQQLVEDDRQQDDVTVSQTEMDYHQMELPEVPSEPPPPLPSMPPPAPNWNTFPTVTGEFANTDDDFFDQNDLLPDLDMAKTSMEKNTGGEEREAPVTPVTPETGCVRTDILRRKSQFLGLEKCEEYHTLQTDKQQKERIEWERIEATDSILKDLRSVADTRPPENLWQPAEDATHDTSYSPYNTSQSMNIFDPSSAYDLEQREMDIIANLERDEEASQLVNNCCHDNGDIYQDQCSSRSTDSVHSSTVASIEARATLDMQNTLSMAPLTHRSPTERRMFDLEEDRRRMEQWDADQEEKRKQLYEAEQQRIRKKHEEELRKSQQLEEERQRELAEKEEKQQQRFDELRRQAEVENQRQQEEQEKIRQAEEKRRIRQQQQEDEKRKLRQVERRSNSRENEQNTFPWQTPQTMREAIDTDRMRVEQEKILAERETARKREDTDRAQKQAEEQQRREEEERVRKAKEEQRRREEERVRKAEEDQRLQEEREAKALREREEQLRLMEERIRREAEKLRLEKERFEMEKTNHQKPWSMPQSNPAGYNAPPEYDAPLIPTHTMPSYEEPKVDKVRLSYVPLNNAYQGQYEQTYEPNHPDNISPTSQPQFHIEFKTEPNRRFTLHQQPDNDYSYHGNNGLSPRTTFEKLPRRELPIQPKPSLREEMGLRPESRRTYGSQSNVAGRSPTGSEASLSDTGREAALRSSRLPSGNSSYYPTRDTVDDNARRHSEYQRRPEPMDDFSPKSAPPWADSLKPVTTTVNQDDQVSPTHLTKAELHQIAAVPRPRFSDNWIKPAEEPKRRPAPRRSEIMRQNINHAGEHWLFEEAERRRLASQQGTQHLQKRQDPLQYQQWWSQKAVAPSDGSNGYSVEYSGDSGYGLPQRYDFDEQSRSLSSPAYRTSYDGSDRYDRYGNQPPLVHPTSTDQVLTDRVIPVRYTDTSPHNHPYSAPKPNSPSYHYAPSSTQQYHYPHSDNLSLSQNPYPSYPDQQQPSQVSYPSAEPVHSRTSSQNSEPPPIPPKPPRLLAGGENSHPAEQVIAVSGYQACANCGDALGQGAAMVIEPLGLYYHIECFRCCVCYAPLGTGERGTDVRVRASRLHCQNCYSSDEGEELVHKHS